MMYSVVMIERTNENQQFYRDVSFYKGSMSAFFLMNKHKKDDRFKEVLRENIVVRREAVLYGTVDLVDSMFPIRYPLVLNDNKILMRSPICVMRDIKKEKAQKYHTGKQNNHFQKLIVKGKRKTIYERDGYKCVICGQSNIGTLTLDHVIPRSKGGSSQNCNLQTMCRSCNSYKADKIITNKELKIQLHKII